MRTHDTDLIHPEDNSNFQYWTKKLGVSVLQLNDAILYTGSLNPVRIKAYLRKDTWYFSPLFGLIKLFKNKSTTIH